MKVSENVGHFKFDENPTLAFLAGVLVDLLELNCLLILCSVEILLDTRLPLGSIVPRLRSSTLTDLLLQSFYDDGNFLRIGLC